MSDNLKGLSLLDTLLDTARKKGADQADAVFLQSTSIQAACRKQQPEESERSESAGIGLRVWKGNRQAMVSSTDIKPDCFAELAERAVAMALVATNDEHVTLAPDGLLAGEVPNLELSSEADTDAEWLLEQSKIAEAAALENKDVTNSEGADASYARVKIAVATRPAEGKGFSKTYDYTSFSLSASVLAGEGVNMQRDYDYSVARHRADLREPEAIGTHAAERAVKRMNPRKVSTAQVPVVFEPRVGRSVLGYFAGAINGSSIARGTSFLKDKMGEKIFAGGITIVDDPHRVRGLGSRPFDGEGVACKKRELIKDGELQSWLLDMRTANKLGLKTTGHAARGMASSPTPSPSNLYMEAGNDSPEALMSDIKSGFYVTETFGMGVNLVTGDYSQGAAGFWIENGEIAYPVAEITIAGHLSDMFASLTPANDLEFRYSANTPTFRIDKMTVAGA